MDVDVDGVQALFLALALAAAFADWLAVAADRPAVEEVAKPLVMVLLIGAALAGSELGAGTRWLVAAGLLFGLVGDVLLLPRRNAFVPGLAAFLVGHVLYLIGFALVGLDAVPTAVGLLAAAGLLGTFGAPIVRSVRGTRLGAPVGLYVGVIAAMVAVACGTGVGWLAVGAITFALSDALLGHDRFVTPRTDRRALVHVLYHLGQMGIVLPL